MGATANIGLLSQLLVTGSIRITVAQLMEKLLPMLCLLLGLTSLGEVCYVEVDEQAPMLAAPIHQ